MRRATAARARHPAFATTGEGGRDTVVAQIAAEGLDLPVGNITVRLGHSAYPDTPGPGGSSGASSCGAALHDACRKLKAKLDAGEGAQGLSATGSVKPGADYKKYSQLAYGAHFAGRGRGAARGRCGRSATGSWPSG